MRAFQLVAIRPSKVFRPVLTHHCDSVETETKIGPSKIAPVVSYLGSAVSFTTESGRDLDQIVAQPMWSPRPQRTFNSAALGFEHVRNWHKEPIDVRQRVVGLLG